MIAIRKIGLVVAALLAVGALAGTAVAAGSDSLNQSHAKMSAPHR
jgi:hypothetical protein